MALFYFANKVKLKVHTVVVNKKYLNKRNQLRLALEAEIRDFFVRNRDYLASFEQIVVYYDNGQKVLANILHTVFADFMNIERVVAFNHTKKRLFQVTDMMTVIDKLDYKYHHKIPFTNAKAHFFNAKDLLYIQKKLNHKKL